MESTLFVCAHCHNLPDKCVPFVDRHTARTCSLPPINIILNIIPDSFLEKLLKVAKFNPFLKS